MIRTLYLRTAAVAVEVLGAAEVAEAWDTPSLLPRLSVGALAGHLARSVFQVDWYLAGEEPLGQLMSAAEYYAHAEGLTEPSSVLNEAIVAEGEDAASCGARLLHERAFETLARLRVLLADAPRDKAVVVSRRRTLLLDDYLRTRIVEMTIHADDLATSVDRPSPELPEEAVDEALRVLIHSAAIRYGARAVLRALTRSDHELPPALRVV